MYASTRHVADGQAALLITEGAASGTPAGTEIDYGHVDSCLTVTCHLDAGRMVGGHLALYASTENVAASEPLQLDSNLVLPRMLVLIGKSAVQRLDVIGAQGWGTELLDKSGCSDFLHQGKEWAESTLDEMAKAIRSRLNLPGTTQQIVEHYEAGFTTGAKKCRDNLKVRHALVVRHLAASRCAHTPK
ncbi:hypothetical protein [Embleya sp. NPDC020630]|uniref:hypothetical protein n=1 Tax=Embleya sp. NPDC020630 TaxID=3363979 RepID=UPI0037BB7B4E